MGSWLYARVLRGDTQVPDIPEVPDIRVPPSQQAGFLAIRDLNDDQFASLRQALAKAEPQERPTITDLVHRVTDSVPDLDPKAARGLVRSLLSVQAGRIVHGDSLTGFVNGIARSDSLGVPPEEAAVLANRIESLAQVPVVAVVAKAIDIAREYDRVYHTARIMTDMRPVFGDDPEAPPVGTIVRHVLRIDAFQNGELENYYVALDSSELRDLQTVIDRAIKKTLSLDRVLDTIGFSRFAVSEEEQGG